MNERVSTIPKYFFVVRAGPDPFEVFLLDLTAFREGLVDPITFISIQHKNLKR